ncbi:MAG: DUF134 domain-containing protein [Myxococcales bacterium]|nr:MAG: DUF134 domain-containing protein [Myxococcales bacterium]
MSPRPKKPRRCSCPYAERAFKPTRIPMDQLTKIFLSHEELEALRLCDAEGLTQEQAGEQMGVSRGTVQRTVAAARAKVALALVEGYALIMGPDDDKEERS